MVAVRTLTEIDRTDLISRCNGIADTVAWLDSIDGRPGLAEIGEKLASTPINVEAIKRHISYADDGYHRNIIKITEHYEMVAVSWKPGQYTPIHDHKGSDCVFLIVDGVSTETTYQLNSSGYAVPENVRLYQPGEVCAAEDQDIHRVSNETAENLINLHIYIPPLTGFGIYAAGEE